MTFLNYQFSIPRNIYKFSCFGKKQTFYRIVCKQPERETINTIIQSLVISDITYDTLYAIRYSLKQYLTNSEIASKSQLTISPSGTIEIKIVPKKESMVSEKSSSLHSVVELPPNQYYRTRSEISAIDKMPDPFVR